MAVDIKEHLAVEAKKRQGERTDLKRERSFGATVQEKDISVNSRESRGHRQTSRPARK